MKKIVVLFVSVFCFNLFGLNVDVNELKKGKKIDFINYTGAGRNDPTSAVRGIGSSLADKMNSADEARFMMKYSVKRVVSDKEPEKLSAEIFSIHKDAQVDHVNNIRKILSAYFEKRFGYNKDEAYALAVFSTYYNAVYRGNVDYLKTVYKTEVMKNINTTNAGLAVRYDEWPGKTKILIPLSEGASGTIDPDEISGKDVIKEVRKDDGNIEPRKTVVDIKEKQIEKEKQEIEKEKKRIEEEKKINDEKKKKIEDDKKKIEEEKKKIVEKDKEIENKKKENAKITDPEKKKQEDKKVEEEKKKVDKAKEEVAKKEETVKQEEKKNEQQVTDNKKKEDEVKKKENEVAKKEETVKEEKKEIANDELKKDVKKGDPKAVDKLNEKEKDLAKKEEELKKKEEALKKNQADRNVIGDKIYYLKIREFLRNGNYNNDLCMIDAANRKILFNSNIPNISGSKYDLFAEGIVVITRVDNEYTEHRLTLVDKEKLTSLKTGTDNIFHRSFVEIRDGFIFAIVKDKDQYFLGRFDKDLKLTAKSERRISQDTFLTFYGDFVYINSEDKKILVLNKADLKFVDVIDPTKISSK
ncbi:MAG TPA: P83/100 family protein [Spirochaetota bacterium]|nr:P83/100 family protein [Spirochaetota bacterium]